MVVRYKYERGPDIEGQLPGSLKRFFIEAKGERPGKHATAKRRVAMGEVLLQILSRYDEDVACAIALPYNRGFQNLVRSIIPGLRKLGLHVLFVKNGDVWHLDPNAGGFFPSKPESIVEVLDK